MCILLLLWMYYYSLEYFVFFFFFLMIRPPPRSTQSRSSAASDVYKRQVYTLCGADPHRRIRPWPGPLRAVQERGTKPRVKTVSYTHLRAHETVLDLVCRLLLEKTKHTINHRSSRTRPFAFYVHSTPRHCHSHFAPISYLS